MSRQRPRISFEYFPPKTEEGKEKLINETTPALNALNPEFFSVTYGAGGSTRDTTLGVVSTIREASCWIPTGNAVSTDWWHCAATCHRAWAAQCSWFMPTSW
jgi:hypothetical protein